MGLFNRRPQSRELEGTPPGAYVFSINVVQRQSLITGADQLGLFRKPAEAYGMLPGFSREKLTDTQSLCKLFFTSRITRNVSHVRHIGSQFLTNSIKLSSLEILLIHSIHITSSLTKH